MLTVSRLDYSLGFRRFLIMLVFLVAELLLIQPEEQLLNQSPYSVRSDVRQLGLQD
jgi:hypothetical protein